MNSPRSDIPDIERIATDIWVFRIPLDGHSIDHANVYALRAERKVLLVDCSWSSPPCRDRLQQMLETIGASTADVSHVLLTHAHVDHCGLAGYLKDAAGSKVVMHAADAAQLRPRYVDQDLLWTETDHWATTIGAPDAAREVALAQQEDFRARFSPMQPDVLAPGGWTIEHGRFRISAIHTPGHTPGHLCFFESTEGLLFTGDTVMPRINYSASYRPFGDPDPLTAQEKSLRSLLEQGARLGLPGHQETFAEPAGRIRQLLELHERRSNQVLDMVAKVPATAWQLSADVPRRRSWADLPMASRLSATGEMMAHLVRLAATGSVIQDPETYSWSRSRR